MSLTKYILKEFISNTKREVLSRKIVLTSMGIKDNNSPVSNDLWDLLSKIHEKNEDLFISDMTPLNIFDTVINLFHVLDNTPNKKYMEWFLLKAHSNYTLKMVPSYAKVTIVRIYDAFKLLIKGKETEENVNLLTRLQYYYNDIKNNTGVFNKVVGDNRRTIWYHSILEDKDRINDAFDLHFKVKQRTDFPQQYKDINNVESFDKLMEILKPYRSGGVNESFENVIQKIQENQDYKVLYEDDEVVIYKPLTEEGACTLGYKTEWCTTWGQKSLNPEFKSRRNQFNTYSDISQFREPPLYIVRWLQLDEESPTKYVQIYWGKEYDIQVMDVNDKSLGNAYNYARETLPRDAFNAMVKDFTTNEINNKTK